MLSNTATGGTPDHSGDLEDGCVAPRKTGARGRRPRLKRGSGKAGLCEGRMRLSVRRLISSALVGLACVTGCDTRPPQAIDRSGCSTTAALEAGLRELRAARNAADRHDTAAVNGAGRAAQSNARRARDGLAEIETSGRLSEHRQELLDIALFVDQAGSFFATVENAATTDVADADRQLDHYARRLEAVESELARGGGCRRGSSRARDPVPREMT